MAPKKYIPKEPRWQQMGISAGDQKVYKALRPQVGLPVQLRHMVSYWDEKHKVYWYPIKEFGGGLIIDNYENFYWPLHGFDADGNYIFSLYKVRSDSHNNRIIEPFSGIVHTARGYTISCNDGFIDNPEYPAVIHSHEDFKVFVLMGRELSLKEFIDKQKDTEFFNKIFALYFAQDGMLNFDEEE